MKAANFIFKDHAVYLIDLDGMSFYQGSSKKYAVIYHKMVARFLKNFKKQPEFQSLFLKRLNDKKEV